MADPRFSALSSDPRYRLPSRKEARTAVDPRFKTLFTDQEFRKKASVDRYGRKIKPEAGKKDLERLYRLDKKEKPKAAQKSEKKVVGSSDESEDDEDSEDEELVTKRDPAREGGFSESESSEEETSDEEESDEEAALAEDTAGQEQTEDIPEGEVSQRLACVNLDWDNIRAADLMAVARSFAPSRGRIENVTIFPSEFGRERLEREEIEGPPKEIFASSRRKSGDSEEEEDDDDDESSDDDEKIKKRILKEQANEGEEFDTAKLRQYQLERLRYYYAIITCDTKQTAKALYDAMDGREYLSTSNFFDLRFVPDETSFDDDKPHDECDQLPSGYKPNDFRTEALTHSKVRLTWDDDDATRKEVQKRAFSRAEMDENDLQAYIGSDDSDADSTTSRKSAAQSKAEAKRQKMREALGLSSEPTKASKKDKDEPVGDMQITFTSGLSGGSKNDKSGVFENEPQDEESTRDRYIRKERERKQKRKEKHKSAATEEESEAAAGADEDEDDEKDPFDDPFFNDPAAAAAQEKAAKKAEKAKKHAARQAADAEAESRRAELELLMANDAKGGDNVKHFDMRELEKAQKAAKRKGKKGVKKDVPVVEDDFKVKTDDPRFKDVFESHEYAVDPTHPSFKGTEGMKALQEERRKRKASREDEGGAPVEKERKKQKKQKGEDGEDLKALAARLQKKSK